MDLRFVPFEPVYKNELVQLIFGLYDADAAGETITLAKIESTIKTFLTTPSLGQIILVLKDDLAIGYTIVINYWSNEYGGFIQFIDEFFVEAKYRNKGIGATFLKYLTEEHFPASVAFALEVMPKNTKALDFYKRLGFVEDGRHHLFFHRKNC